jgi:non-ribosomal peptide synthetase component F
VQLAEVLSQSGLGRNLFDHILVFENFPVQEIIGTNGTDDTSGSNLSLSSFTVFEQSNYNFTLTVIPGEIIGFKFVYNESLFDEVVIDRLQDHLIRIVEKMVEAPDELVHALDYLSDSEKYQLLVAFNPPETGYDRSRTFVHQFEEQVAENPENIALVFGQSSLTYRQLNETANQLACYLKKNYAISGDDLVSIKLERSEWMVISILAVLKSGGAYLPIDPAYPEDRIRYMLEDSRCKALVDEGELKKF